MTTEPLYRRKVAAIRAQLPTLEHVILVPEDGEPRPTCPDTLDWHGLVDSAEPGLRHSADRSGGSRAAAFHQRHHRPAEGRDPRA